VVVAVAAAAAEDYIVHMLLADADLSVGVAT